MAFNEIDMSKILLNSLVNADTSKMFKLVRMRI